MQLSHCPPGTAGARTWLRAPSGTRPRGPQRLGPPAPLGQRHPPSRRLPHHGRPGLTHGPSVPGPRLRGWEGRHGPSTAAPELRASAPVTPSNPSLPGCGPTASPCPDFSILPPPSLTWGDSRGPSPSTCRGTFHDLGGLAEKGPTLSSTFQYRRELKAEPP